MALYIRSADGRQHEYLYQTIQSFYALSLHFGIRLFCVNHGCYEELKDLDLATSKEAKHRIETFRELDRQLSIEEAEKVNEPPPKHCYCSNPRHKHRKGG